jgi:hypothetical protein
VRGNEANLLELDLSGRHQDKIFGHAVGEISSLLTVFVLPLLMWLLGLVAGDNL